MQDAQPSPNAEQRLNRLNGHRDVLDDAAQEDESKHLQGLLDWSDNHRIVFYCLGGIFLGFQVGPEMDGLVAWTIAWFEKRGGGGRIVEACIRRCTPPGTLLWLPFLWRKG